MADSTNDLAGSVALVTGAGSGIGRACCLALAGAGAAVAAVDVDLGGAEETLALLTEAGGTGIACRADVREASQCEATVAETLERLGKLDVLVNNAGVGFAGDLLEMDLGEFETTWSVNVLGTIHMSRAALPHMIEAGGGAIINVSSVAAIRAVRRRAGYIASKGAILSLTRSMASDFVGRGIRCNAVAPGTIASPWIERITAEAADPRAAIEAMRQRQPLGRMGEPEEVAAAVRFLASPAASFFHGSVLVLDGGFLWTS